MTLQELYASMEGDYEQACRVLRIEKLIDKHIRRFPTNPVFANLVAAGESMDPTALFESAHAIKGVCANLGLVKLSETASAICEEFRPGNPRKQSDEQISLLIQEALRLHDLACEKIALYAGE